MKKTHVLLFFQRVILIILAVASLTGVYYLNIHEKLIHHKMDQQILKTTRKILDLSDEHRSALIRIEEQRKSTQVQEKAQQQLQMDLGEPNQIIYFDPADTKKSGK